jgi:hypothetical protein
MTDQRLLTDDIEHLRLLSIFHYIVGGLVLLFACFSLIHVTIGSIFIYAAAHAHSASGDAPPEIVGWILLFFGLALFTFGVAFGVAVLWSGRCLARRKHYQFSLVMACVECLFVPFGTVLGVFTLVILSRESVKAVYFPAAVTPTPAGG